MLASTENMNYINPALAKSSAGISLPQIQKAQQAPTMSVFFCAHVMMGCMDEALRSAVFLLSGKANSELRPVTLRLASFGDGFKNRYQKESIMDNNQTNCACNFQTLQQLIDENQALKEQLNRTRIDNNNLINTLNQTACNLSLLQDLSIDCENQEMHLSRPSTSGFYYTMDNIIDNVRYVSEELSEAIAVDVEA